MKVLSVVLICLLCGCQNKDDSRDAKIASLEQRVTKLENSAKDQAQNDAMRLERLRSCVTVEADAVYNGHLRINAISHHGSTMSVPVAAAEEAMRLKQQKIEQCKLLWGHQ